MILKEIAKEAKKRKTLFYFTRFNVQWLATGVAAYPLYNLPPLEPQHIYTILDIPEKDRNKISIVDKSDMHDFIEYLSLTDMDDTETVLDDDLIIIKGCRPYKTSHGLSFLDLELLRPFRDEANIEIYERISQTGSSYFAVKSGLLLLGVIMPCELVSKEFVEQLEELLGLAMVKLDNKLLDEEKRKKNDKFIPFNFFED